jgi:hypothetical protein
MQKHFEKTRESLAEDPIEAFKVAMAVVEERHQETVRRYGLLTTPSEPAKMASEAPGSPRVESVTLTSGDETSSKLVRTPPSAGDYKARALEAYRKHSTSR